ncbi:hypothetical protein [Sphingomonas crocodyli]|uniref:Capsule biosynthesis protein n=1 Tax=Sphingomonas crocodyli TaxID=1979270 RepID=A0A437MBM2_9SPHN|nr:hypothetical protein [Sphingomonas crocodyli]RVT94953.1 hypothetical protein EOD43_14450 [Sphingomonas crocodyli]
MIETVIERLKKLGPLFLLTVVIPVICAIIYFGLLASKVYISESQFVVRNPEKASPSGLSLLLKSSGMGGGGGTDEVAAAEAYVNSRDALRELNKDGAIEQAFSRSSISLFDRYNATGLDDSFEDLFSYFHNHVTIEHSTSSVITKLSVRAYTAEDAYQINRRLLELSENLVNQLNERSRRDLISSAEDEVREAKNRASRAAQALSAYRNARGVVDPEKQALVQVQGVMRLQEELIAAKARLAEMRAFTPNSPQIALLGTRVRELTAQVANENAKNAGAPSSLSTVAAQYQRVQLESQLADRQLAAAIAALTDARNEALRKHVYVVRISQPNLPDEAREPRRLRGILATLILGIVTWGILSMLLAGVREHNE